MLFHNSIEELLIERIHCMGVIETGMEVQLYDSVCSSPQGHSQSTINTFNDSTVQHC
jgi:hypothetical protein